jgi:hypothetical protein
MNLRVEVMLIPYCYDTIVLPQSAQFHHTNGVPGLLSFVTIELTTVYAKYARKKKSIRLP